MQDVGTKEDTELSREDLTHRWQELPVESPGHCPVCWKLNVFSVRVRNRLRTPWKKTLSANCEQQRTNQTSDAHDSHLSGARWVFLSIEECGRLPHRPRLVVLVVLAGIRPSRFQRELLTLELRRGVLQSRD